MISGSKESTTIEKSGVVDRKIFENNAFLKPVSQAGRNKKYEFSYKNRTYDFLVTSQDANGRGRFYCPQVH